VYLPELFSPASRPCARRPAGACWAVGVPEHLLDHARVHVGLEHEGGCSVPEHAEAHVREAPEAETIATFSVPGEETRCLGISVRCRRPTRCH
jgi:hypothetical protein